MYTTLISARELAGYLGTPGWVIVDCRYSLADRAAGFRNYLHGHIPGAIYADLHEDLSGPPLTDCGRHPMPSPDRLRELFSGMGIAADTQVIVYDDSCGSIAARLWWQLQYMNHGACALLDGGWQSWQNAGGGEEPGETRNHPATFQGHCPSARLLVVEEIPGQALLIDSREPERYRGETEPIDPVAGHIPGARNHYWKNNLRSDGTFQNPAQLRETLLRVYAGNNPGDAVFYCGSGVTACHNILAAVRAGLPAPGLYAGSWSEWCADPSRPVAGPASGTGQE